MTEQTCANCKRYGEDKDSKPWCLTKEGYKELLIVDPRGFSCDDWEKE